MPADREWPFGGYAGIGDEAAPELAGQLAAVRALGWSGIELRTVDRVAVADLDAARFGELAEAVHAEGLRVVCLDSRIGNWACPITHSFRDDLSELAVLAQRCDELGCRFVRVMSWPNDGLADLDWRHRVLDRMRRLAARAEGAGLTLLHENCAGWAGERADRALELLDAVGSPALRLLFDTGNGIEHGYRAADLLAELVPHVAHVHVKDATADAQYTLPGDGTAGVLDCLRLLRTHGYRGALSLEPHLDTRPHEGRWSGGTDGFLAAGRRLMRLVGELAEVPAR